MRSKTMRKQNAQHNGKQQATSMRMPRKQPGSPRAQTRVFMTTEYQERFIPPYRHTTLVTSLTRKDPYHPLKGTSVDMVPYRSFYVTNKWIQHPPKAPQPSLPPKGHQRCRSTPQNLARFVGNPMPSKVDYTSTYKNDFKEWKTKKLQPYKLSDSLKVNQGLVVTNTASREGCSHKKSVQVAANSDPVPQVQETQPIESVTSYRLDYVTHPVQPRTRREKPVSQTKGLLSEPAVSLKPKAALDINQVKAKESSQLADHNDFLSTTHADYTAHKCQRTKPILPAMQTTEKSKEPFQTTTAMKEDYKAWVTPRRVPIVPKEELDWPKKTTFSRGTPNDAESCKTNLKPFSLSPNLNETAVCQFNCNATETPENPAGHRVFSALECISTGTGEYTMLWGTSLDDGVTWADGGISEDPPQNPKK